MSRAALFSLYALLVLIWSSTWVAIKFGLEDTALLGAGLRFALAGAVLLGFAALSRRPLRTDWLLVAVLAAMPFALAYGLVYWGEQYIPSGLAAVLFGVLPLYTGILAGLFLPEEPLRARLVIGVVIAIGGLALSFAESLNLGDEDLALAGAAALALAPLGAAVGNVSQKLRARSLDAVTLNGWAMLAGGALLLGVSALGEDWGALRLTPESVGSIVYLALGFRGRVRGTDRAPAASHRSSDVLPGHAAPVRRAAVRGRPVRRVADLAGAGRRAAGGARTADRAGARGSGARGPRVRAAAPPQLEARLARGRSTGAKSLDSPSGVHPAVAAVFLP